MFATLDGCSYNQPDIVMSSFGLPLLLAGPQEDFFFLLGRLQALILPEGVLADVMLHLDPRDVLACRLVNKTWSRAAAAAVRHLDLPCKALAAAAAAGSAAARGGDSDGRVDATLRRLHRVWPAAEAVSLSGLAAGQALHAELSLQLLANHLSRWRNLRELNLRDMPVSPAPGPPRLATAHPHPVSAPAATHMGRIGAPGEAGSSWQNGGWQNGGGSGPGPWSLGCLSCCLGLARLEVELVPAREPSTPAPPHRRQQQHRCGEAWAQQGEYHCPQQQQEQQQRVVWQHVRRPGPAQLAAGQAELLESLTRLTRLTHLSIRLLDLSQTGDAAAAAGADESDAPESSGEGAGSHSGDEETEGAAWWEGEAEAAVAAGGASAEEEEYALDAEEAGDYGSDLDVGLGSDRDPDHDLAVTAGRTEGEEGAAQGGARGQAAAASAAARGSGEIAAAAPCELGRGESRGLAPASSAAATPTHNHQRAQRRRLRNVRQKLPYSGMAGECNESSGDGVGSSGGGGSSSGGNDDLPEGGAAAAGGVAGLAPALATAAASRGAGRHWSPHPALFTRLGLRLCSLRLTGCELRGGGALAALAGALTGLTSLSLQGRLAVSHDDLAALSCLRDLRDLSLSRVELLYDPRDPDDCPVALMTELYGALQQLRHFESLRFDLDPSGVTGIHSAYLLPLYDTPLAQLRSLNLSTVVLDSDYSFHMLGKLTTLTALTMSYVTWPLALWPDDMTLLAPLSGLRRFSMHSEPSERHHLIALSGRVVAVLAEAWPQLSQLAFTGKILPDKPGAPSMQSLAAWTSLRDLSLSAAPDGDDAGHHSYYTSHHNHHNHHSRAPGSSRLSGSSSCSAASDGADSESGSGDEGGGGGGGAATDMPYMYDGGDDEDGEAAATAVGALELGVCIGRCLPPGLTRLALGGLRLRAGELLRLLAGPLTGLTSLQVLDCGLTPAHLMVGDTGATQLQVLVLNDSHPWRACHSRSYYDDRSSSQCRIHVGQAACMLRHGSTAGGARDRGAAASPGPHRLGPSASPSPSRNCSCCCALSIWASRTCLGGPTAAPKTGGLHSPRPPNPPTAGSCVEEGSNGERPVTRDAAKASLALGEESLSGGAAPQQDRRQHWEQRYTQHDVRQERSGGRGGRSQHGGGSWGSSTESGESDTEPERAAGGGDGIEAGVGARQCGCWRRQLIRHSLATLGSLRSLEFLLLGVPDDELEAAEVLAPLAALTGLRHLTLRARGLRSAVAGEVSEPLGRLMQLRSLRLTGPRPDSMAAHGAEDAARCLPYLR